MDNENFLKKLAENLKEIQAAEIKKLKAETELKFRKPERNFIEIESCIEQKENFSSFEIGNCIFFDNAELNEEVKTLPYGLFFLSVPYEDLKNFLHKDFCGQNFKYRLTPNYQFIEAEKKIFSVSEIYNLPIQIYSPYARRAVDICISEKSSEDFTRLDELNFRLAENNLSDKLLMNNKFFWNVEIKKSVDLAWFKNHENYFEYGFDADEQSYILPKIDLNFYSGIEAEKSDGKIILRSIHELPEEFELIKILPVENKIAPRIFSKPRIRTIGDIEFILKCFENENFSCSFVKFGGGDKILRYSKEFAYPTSQEQELLCAKLKLPVISIKFFGDRKFLTDYANYVLYFLERNYPEFNWAGEIDERF